MSQWLPECDSDDPIYQMCESCKTLKDDVRWSTNKHKHVCDACSA